jgi:hypothetical protein
MMALKPIGLRATFSVTVYLIAAHRARVAVSSLYQVNCQTTGRPVGSEAWLAELERRSGRRLTPAKRGPKRGGKPMNFVNCHRNPI